MGYGHGADDSLHARCRLGIALALNLLRVAVGFGEYDFALFVGIGTNFFALRGTG